MASETPDQLDAYALLSRPTLDYTDEEVALVVEQLRKARSRFLATGTLDKPKAAKAATVKLDADEKARNTALLLASLKLPGAK